MSIKTSFADSFDTTVDPVLQSMLQILHLTSQDSSRPVHAIKLFTYLLLGGAYTSVAAPLTLTTLFPYKVCKDAFFSNPSKHAGMTENLIECTDNVSSSLN